MKSSLFREVSAQFWTAKSLNGHLQVSAGLWPSARGHVFLVMGITSRMKMPSQIENHHSSRPHCPTVDNHFQHWTPIRARLVPPLAIPRIKRRKLHQLDRPSDFGIHFAYRVRVGFRSHANGKEERIMRTILHLQTLTPTETVPDFNVAFSSSVSSVCPTTLAGDEPAQFQLD
jgi:hypothetical protein